MSCLLVFSYEGIQSVLGLSPPRACKLLAPLWDRAPSSVITPQLWLVSTKEVSLMLKNTPPHSSLLMGLPRNITWLTQPCLPSPPHTHHWNSRPHSQPVPGHVLAKTVHARFQQMSLYSFGPQALCLSENNGFWNTVLKTFLIKKELACGYPTPPGLSHRT